MPETDARAAAAAELRALFDDEWERWMRESPTWASSLGDRRWNDRWDDESLAAERRRHEASVAALARLEGIDVALLAPTDRIDRDLFHRHLREAVESFRYRWWLLPLNQRGGLQTEHETAERLRFETVKDYEDWTARLRALGTLGAQVEERMREGMRVGMVHPRVIMERVPAQLDKQIVADPEQSPFWRPFTKVPDAIAGAERERLREAARAAVREAVVPAYRRFRAFFVDEYLPACRASVGAAALPDGEEFYAFAVRRFTTTEMTPAEVHRLGLAEVARIRAEMEAIVAEVGFTRGFDAFLEHLRTDERFYYKDPEELLAAYRAFSKQVDPELVRLFGRLPRMPYGVRPIPPEAAPDTTTAYYSGPAADGSRAGIYWVNLYRPEVRPKYEIEALSLHEAVPGHHLQIALAQELEGLPKFRRYTGYTAFTEGWGLYAESLGRELGFYRDPYARFGQLTYEMWRAVRLVVDTGLHAMGWGRQEAIDYFKANAAKSEADIVNEIDRYIAWPGQAVAYKVGELRIKALRRRAEAELGARFDVRGFHDAVLGSGAVPLDVLERSVLAWVEGRRAGAPPAPASP